MREFTSIESFRHVIATVNRYCEAKGKPLPTITYRGTLKLHGTNAGVRVTDTRVQPQGRTRILDIGSDNFGFAAFCHDKTEVFTKLAKKILGKDKLKNQDDITIYGEWIGKGIQKGVAVSELDRQFVIFNVWIGRDNYKDIEYITSKLSADEVKEFNSLGIWFIDQVPHFTIEIDFRWPQKSVQVLDELTLAAENECPWGKLHGVSGVGEGYVWVPTDPEYRELTDLWFKTKGLKHKNPDAAPKQTAIDPAKVNSIQQFVEAVLPEWRLEQGISQMRQDGKDIIAANTGEYLKWISQDVLKEEADVLVANGLVWKDVVGHINRTAREYYLKEVNSAVGL